MDYLRYAECFYTLGKTLSFTKASNEMGIAQPAISRQIRLLEEQLGVQLFIRTKHQVNFTPEGLSFFKNVAPLLERIEQETEQVKGNSGLKGSINIGALSGIGEEFLMPITLKFKKLYPDIHLNIFYLKTEDIAKDLIQGKVDFAFFNELIDLEIVRSYKLFTEKSYLVTNAKNSENFDPKKAYFISYKSDDPMLKAYFKKFYPEFKYGPTDSVLTVNSIPALIKILKEFDYYSVLAEHMVYKDIQSKELQIILPKKSIKSDVYFSYIDQEFIPRRHTIFKDYFLQNIREQLIALSY